MLSSLILENFKAFGGERVVIPFAPLTFIFGANSAGKSTILQALLLLKQSAEANGGMIRDFSPKLDSPHINMGGSADIVFNQQDRSLSWEITPVFKVVDSRVRRVGQIGVDTRLVPELAKVDQAGVGLRITPIEQDGKIYKSLSNPLYINDTSQQLDVEDNDYPDLFLLRIVLYEAVRRMIHIAALRYRVGRTITIVQPTDNNPERDIYALLTSEEVLDRTNEVMRKFGIGYQLLPQPPLLDGLSSPREIRIELVDEYAGITVGPMDVGVGVSQVLPVLIQATGAKQSITLIEQPELHLHPRLQAELGGLFADSYKEHNNQFIIETHSEHLILRLQRLIRRGELSPEDVCVLFVDRDSSGSHFRRLRLDSHGKFIDPWPGGFFEESFNEVFGDLIDQLDDLEDSLYDDDEVISVEDV